MNVLVLAAHPDDEVLGCGGTIARLASEGHRVTVAIFGQGAASRYAPASLDALANAGTLKSQSYEAARILGNVDIKHFDLPDNRFDSVDLLDIIKTLEGLAGVVRPHEVYTQHGGDLNIDHAITFRAAMTCFRPIPDSSVRALYAFEVASSTEWAFGKFSPAFIPDTFIDISMFLDRKLKALAAYQDELRSSPHPRSIEGVSAQARDRGARVGVGAAEAFATVWRKV
jgi:LmbE family N-acetylglucosaminyl deacetylase